MDVRSEGGKTVDLLDVLLYLFAYPHGRADDFVPDAAGVDGWAPATAEGVQVAAADAAVGDFDVDVGFLPGFGLVGLPDHFSFGGVFVLAQPSLELVVGGHDCGVLDRVLSVSRVNWNESRNVNENVAYESAGRKSLD